ncbi:MAG TPA: hypothetical protein VID93_09610 [Acidimicrobiales bacterium]
MIVHLPWEWVVVLDAAAWAAWSALAGWWTGRPSAARRHGRPDTDGPVLRLRSFEIGGHWYQTRLHIRAWKGRLPEAGGAFGGRSKRQLPPGGAQGLPTFLTECRRAERTHWIILAAMPVFAVWNPPGLLLAMVAFAIVANLPCLAVLRYNRARVLVRQPGCSAGDPASRA